MKTFMCAVLAVSMSALAAPPERRELRKGDVQGAEGDRRQDELAKKVRLMAAVDIADALELNETETLKIAEKLKTFEERRRPLREAMGESMRMLKAAADGDAAAGQQVDQHVQKVLDGRTQMAAIDKELFASLSTGLNAQKKAKLALALARIGHDLQKMRGEFRGRD